MKTYGYLIAIEVEEGAPTADEIWASIDNYWDGMLKKVDVEMLGELDVYPELCPRCKATPSSCGMNTYCAECLKLVLRETVPAEETT